MKPFFARTFRSLRTRNYRLYFIGQAVSHSGDWMQSVGQLWLVLQLTGSATALGLTTAFQSLPMLVGGAWGGVLSDRVDKRRLLLVTQSVKLCLALVLGAITATGVARLWMVYAIALCLGCANAIDNPARRSFVMELAGPADVANAVSLNSALLTTARMIGPALAGLLIAGVGIAWCFFVNSLTFIAVIVALTLMRPDELFRGERVARAPGQVREGLRYALGTPDIRLPLMMMAVIGTLAYNFRVILPLMAGTLGGGAELFGALYSIMSIGSLSGALFTASRHEATTRFMAFAALAFGVVILAAASAPNLLLEGVALVAVGAASASFTSTTQATLQQRSDPAMRGRVMALYSVVFLGSTPIGGPIVGWVTEHFGVRVGFALGGVATLITALAALRVVSRRPAPIHEPLPVGVTEPESAA